MQAHIISPEESSEYYFEEGCYIWELSNSDMDPDLSIARARVLAGTSTKLHKLFNTIERYVILAGQANVFLGADAPTAIAVKQGDVIIIPANCPQAITNTGNSDLLFMVLCTPRFVAKNYSECA